MAQMDKLDDIKDETSTTSRKNNVFRILKYAIPLFIIGSAGLAYKGIINKKTVIPSTNTNYSAKSQKEDEEEDIDLAKIIFEEVFLVLFVFSGSAFSLPYKK